MPITKQQAKKIVQEIHKEAQPFRGHLTPITPGTPPPSGAAVRGGQVAGVVGATHPTGGTASNTAVMAMQTAIQNFAADVSKQLDIQQMLSQDPREQQEAKHRDAFGVFLTKNYMRNTKVPGVEFNPDPAARKMSDKKPDDPTRMSVVMDTMNRIGHETSERFIDGNWGPRTNAAVRDVYAFASGLFDMVDDINRFSPQQIKLQNYSKASLQNLEGMATADNSLTPAQKLEAAPLVTRHVKAIQAAYDELKDKVLQNRTYRQFIEGDVPYKSYGPSVSSSDIELLTNYFKPQGGIKVEIPNLLSSYIDVDSLTDLTKLKQWLNQAAHDAYSTGRITPTMVVDAIQKSLGHMPEPSNTSMGPLAMPSSEPGY